MPNSDDIALIGWNVSPMVRNTDKTEAQMLLEVVSGAVDDRPEPIATATSMSPSCSRRYAS